MDNQQLPLVSFFVIAYKEEEYIRDAVLGAFNQDYPNLEIILSDDGSPDRTFDIMKEMADEYKGPHKIILNQNKPNLGPRDHYCKILYELSHGKIIVFADGDDISLPNRTSVAVDFLLKNPDVMSLSFESQLITEKGEMLPNPTSTGLSKRANSVLTLEDYVSFNNFFIFSGDSRVIRREVIDAFPPLKYSYSEDLFFFVRSLYLGSIAYLRQPLVLYRQRAGSIMGKSRSRKKIKKKDIYIFNETSAKQLEFDLNFAIEKGYVESEGIQFVEKKIHEVIHWLSPKKTTITRRVLRAIYHHLREKIY